MYVLDRFDMLMSKIILKKKKIIGMHFGAKSYLKSNRNHTAKQYNPTGLDKIFKKATNKKVLEK